MITIEQLYREDVGESYVISVGYGKELRGPCPVCGGKDRFGVHLQKNKGVGDFFCGRYAGASNTGCGIGGDIFSYLKEVRGLGYIDACGFLGVEPKNTKRRSHYRFAAPNLPATKKKDKWAPTDAKYPEEVEDPQKWHEHGMKFVDLCHAELLRRQGSLAYLMGRGISMETIKAYKLGYHDGQEYRGKKQQPSYRPWPSWGLRNEKIGWRVRKIALPAGIVIPSMVDGVLHSITIRMNQVDKNGVRYHDVRGSIKDLWLTDAGTGDFVTIEAKLDCLAVVSAAGDLVGTVGIGSTGVRPDSRAARILSGAKTILGALDFDKPKKNPKTGRLMVPGGQAERWWKQHYPRQHKRWPVPVGKDPGEAFEAGVNLRDWIEVGLGIRGAAADGGAEVKAAPEASNGHKQRDEGLHNGLVLETTLSNGEPIYLVRFVNGRLTDDGRRAWRELTAEGKAVFTEKEMAYLQTAIGEMDPGEKLEAGLKVIELKKMFGGVVSNGRKVAGLQSIESIFKKESEG